MADIDSLRAIARKRQRAVGQKISRIRRQVGAELGATKFDPRKPISTVNNMNEAQLSRYIKKLNTFQNRKRQFESLAENKPAPRNIVRSWQSHGKIVNENANALNKAINPIPIAGESLASDSYINTIGSQKAMLATSSIPRMTGEANKPFRMSDLNPRNVRSLTGLNKLEKQARIQSSPKYLEKKIEEYRGRVDLALSKMNGSDAMRGKFNELSDFQFMALWDTPGAFDNFFSKYETMQKRTVETIDSDDEFDKLWNGSKSGDDSDGLLEWASRIERPEESPI